jgi:hypothetical protein
LLALDEAPDLATLDVLATGPGKPMKGTRQYELTSKTYLRRKAALSANGASAS